MNDGPSSGNVSESNASVANNAEELDTQGSIDKRVRSIKLFIANNITSKIRSKLPNVACYLKRLARLKNGGKSESEREGIGSPEVSEIMEVSINEQNASEGRGSVDWSENRVMETRWYETASDPSNPEGPSTSTANTNDDTSESPIIATTSQIEPAQTISNSVTTTETMTTNGIFMSVRNRDTTLAENIMLFREALSSHIGSQTERLREIRGDPLVYIQSEDRHELYLGGTANGESEFSGSSTIRSEIGSVAEIDNRSREVRNQRIGQDPTQFFDTLLNVDRILTRKPIRRNDDESSIY
ncbi:uncharacterized protein LOC122531364 [Frieseomelitta varia]|uniref:uncharacterized protein LOC122531364 n=1 Tax=Frieseomelitta varia TaxID=561572 RepID=UPI001CB68D9A|nr:uncharacterized protein LOC122531364 [Frieseomelitta varia]